MPDKSIEDLQQELEDLLGAAGRASLQAWLVANGLSIVRLKDEEDGESSSNQ